MIAFTQRLPLESDENPIDTYVQMVFGYCEGHASIRLLAEKDTPSSPPKTHSPLIDTHLAATLRDLVAPAARESRGLFIVPCAFTGPGKATTDKIAQTCVIPVDLDTGDVEAKKTLLERHLGPASMVVASGGMTEDGAPKLHLYWKLTEAASGSDLPRVAQLRARLATAAGGDPSFARLTQLIRIPGSVHGKGGVRNEVSILDFSNREYDLDELIEAAEMFPELAARTAPGRDAANAGPPMSGLLKMRVHEGGRDGITRFDAMSRVIGHWLRRARTGDVSIAQAFSHVEDYNQHNLLPPWPAPRVRTEFDALLRKDEQENANAWAGDQHHHTNLKGEGAPLLSEDALANAFVGENGHDWRFVHAWGQWFHWQGKFWVPDETQMIIDQVRQVCRAAAGPLEPAKARSITMMRTIKAVERLASSDPRVAAVTGDWDQHEHLLNTPEGTFDLSTGEHTEHDRDHCLTQCTRATPSKGCPLWLRFLDKITGGDSELQAYLARLAGYCLSGNTREQAFFFLHGNGGNGKSEFLHAITHAIGNYAATAPLDSFMARGSGSHPTDLAGLRGKRLVTVSETEAGLAWAETRIKTITGGDPIRARTLYRDFFEFTPTFKLVVAGNHRPNLVNVGEAMRRRLHLVPFDVTIPEEQRDKSLRKCLEEEADGILDWMLEGHWDWRQRGLAPPGAVQEASRNYFADEDLIGQWIAEQCDVGNGLSATAQTLFENWSRWADSCGAERGSKKSFGEALRSRGYFHDRTRKSRLWKGLALRGPAQGNG